MEIDDAEERTGAEANLTGNSASIDEESVREPRWG
jgi:hypothetical protein